MTSRLSITVRTGMEDSTTWRSTGSDKEDGGFLQELFERCGKQSSTPSCISIFRDLQRAAALAAFWNTHGYIVVTSLLNSISNTSPPLSQVDTKVTPSPSSQQITILMIFLASLFVLVSLSLMILVLFERKGGIFQLKSLVLSFLASHNQYWLEME